MSKAEFIQVRIRCHNFVRHIKCTAINDVKPDILKCGMRADMLQGVLRSLDVVGSVNSPKRKPSMFRKGATRAETSSMPDASSFFCSIG